MEKASLDTWNFALSSVCVSLFDVFGVHHNCVFCCCYQAQIRVGVLPAVTKDGKEQVELECVSQSSNTVVNGEIEGEEETSVDTQLNGDEESDTEALIEERHQNDIPKVVLTFSRRPPWKLLAKRAIFAGVCVSLLLVSIIANEYTSIDRSMDNSTSSEADYSLCDSLRTIDLSENATMATTIGTIVATNVSDWT